MTEDFQVKQSSSNTGAYGLTGAAIGGACAGYGVHRLTKPKYGTYNDIIAEKKDSFEKKYTDIPEDDKKFIDDTKELLEKKEGFESEYDTKLTEYQTAHKEDKVETDKFKELKEKVAAETDATKKAQLEEELGKLTEADKYKTITEDQLKSDFHKGLGENISDKKTYVDNQLKDTVEKYKSDYAEKIKRKWGFAEHYSWKLATAIAGGAIVVGWLAKALAPKNN